MDRLNSGFGRAPNSRRTLDRLVEATDDLEMVRKMDLGRGDFVLVRTRNSTYSISSLGDGTYLVSGGWFDREGLSPHRTGINGCTWGGTAIKEDIVAATGLFLEFGNSVTTTRIQGFRLLRAPDPLQ